MCVTSSSFANSKALYEHSYYPVSHFLWLLRMEAPVPISYCWELDCCFHPHAADTERLFPSCAGHMHFILWVRPLQFSQCWAGFCCNSSNLQLNCESRCSDHLLSLHFHKLSVKRHQISFGNVHFPVQALLFTFSETIQEYKLPTERDVGSLSHLCIPIAKLRAR